jgi:hypothetical protein
MNYNMKVILILTILTLSLSSIYSNDYREIRLIELEAENSKAMTNAKVVLKNGPRKFFVYALGKLGDNDYLDGDDFKVSIVATDNGIIESEVQHSGNDDNGNPCRVVSLKLHNCSRFDIVIKDSFGNKITKTWSAGSDSLIAKLNYRRQGPYTFIVKALDENGKLINPNQYKIQLAYDQKVCTIPRFRLDPSDNNEDYEVVLYDVLDCEWFVIRATDKTGKSIDLQVNYRGDFLDYLF